MSARDVDRERLRWIDDLLTPVAIFAAVEGLLAVGFDVREAFFGGEGILHTIGFWFVVAIVCIERYALTTIEPVRRGAYQVLLWAAVVSSCLRFEMLSAGDAFVVSLVTSLTVLTGVGVFAQRLTAAMNRSLVKDAVSLDVMDAIYGRVRDRASGVVLQRIDGELVARIDVASVEAEERARATDDARARRSLVAWGVAGTVWLAIAGALIELADPGARRSVLVHGAQFAVATPLLLAIASMRSRRERVVERGGRAPHGLVLRRLGAAAGVLAVSGALGALVVPLAVPAASPGGVVSSDVGRGGTGDAGASTPGEVESGASCDDGVGASGDVGSGPSGDVGSGPSGDAGVGASGDAGSGPSGEAAAPSPGRDGAASSPSGDGRRSGSPSRSGPRARPEAAFGGCAFASNGVLVVARLVLAIALLVTLYRWLTGRRRVRVRAHSDGPVRGSRREVSAWLADVGGAPLDEVPARAWAAIRDVAAARGIAGAAELAPRELVHALTVDRPAWEPDLRALARRYEQAVFGGLAVDAAGRTEWLAALSRLLPAIRDAGPLPVLDKPRRTT